MSLAIGDFNNDTRLDIAVANPGLNNVGVFLGYTNEAFINQTSLTTGNISRPRSFAIGYFNNDNRVDIAVANSVSNSVGVFLGYGYGDFANQTMFPTVNDSRPYSTAVDDFNNDTQLDIVVANYNSNNIGVFIGYGNRSIAKQKIYTTASDSHPNSVTVSDFNNDTVPDIAVANYDTSDVYIFFGYGNSTFTNSSIFSIGYESLPFLIIVGDFNKDNKLDLVIANDGYDNLEVLL